MSQAARPNSIRSPIFAGWMCIGILLLHGCLPAGHFRPRNICGGIAHRSLQGNENRLRKSPSKHRINWPSRQPSVRLQIEQGRPVCLPLPTARLNALMEAKRVEPVKPSPKQTGHHALANPSQVLQFEDLAKASKIIIGTEQVPVGIMHVEQPTDSMERILSKNHEARCISESNARLVQAKGEMGEADTPGLPHRRLCLEKSTAHCGATGLNVAPITSWPT